jgi:dethiobiotin synthetase
MNRALIITGTDTDVGKSVVAAGLAGSIAGARYWKPIQAGVDPVTDRMRVGELSGLMPARLLPEAYCLQTPASPHLAAKLDGVVIDSDHLALPRGDGPLIIEGAGGVLVPINEHQTMADLFVAWAAPVILVARTALGTINHSLLSIEALRARSIQVAGIIFVGDAHAENERIIPVMSGVRSFGRLPLLDRLNAEQLRAAIDAHLDIAAIKSLLV